MAFIFNEENFEQEALKSEIPVLIDFYADWCGPCKMLAPTIEALASEYEGTIKIGKLNVDDNSSIAAKYKVMAIPTLLFVKDGQVVETVNGVVSKDVLIEKISKL